MIMIFFNLKVPTFQMTIASTLGELIENLSIDPIFNEDFETIFEKVGSDFVCAFKSSKSNPITLQVCRSYRQGLGSFLKMWQI